VKERRYVQGAEVLKRSRFVSAHEDPPRSWAKELPAREAIQESAYRPEDSPASCLAGGCSTLSSLNRRGITEDGRPGGLRVPAKAAEQRKYLPHSTSLDIPRKDENEPRPGSLRAESDG
jgi:hypothetical protein